MGPAGVQRHTGRGEGDLAFVARRGRLGRAKDEGAAGGVAAIETGIDHPDARALRTAGGRQGGDQRTAADPEGRAAPAMEAMTMGRVRRQN